MQTKTLFSLHYLQSRLPDHPEWAEDPQAALAALRPVWQKAMRYGDAWNEAQTEEEFVKPVLQSLGWSYIVQAKSTRRGQVTRPDYALFAGAAARDDAYDYQGDDDAFYGRAMAIAEAKYWGRPLSQTDSSGRNTWKAESNPSHQMVSYLVGTRAPWGILTNGRVWRLYSREVSSTASEFYEVDLAPLLDSLPEGAQPSPAQLDQFRRWWLFFRRAALTPDAGGRSFVQRVHEGSATYARQISDKLKELVFEEVMPEIAGGFVAYRRQQTGVGEETEESLRQVYQASLSLLYKLLFLLYAEARGLLPMDNPGYREQSLTAMARWAAERLDAGRPISDTPHATPRYDALLALFHRIDRGDPSLGIPRYNGGLFNPAHPDNRFLEGHKLSDRAVARAVDILVRDAGQPVDYAYISVRNLGAIYEGLLENRLVVDRPTGSSETLRVSLINDKGERKASGSYYTPDYIVDYIVRHTLDPILAERDAAFRAAMDRCADLRGRLARTADSGTAGLLRGQLADAERDAREAFLGIKVLDPAMGSGHFLVNAVDHLTDGIIQRMQTYHDGHLDVPWTWNPIQALIEKVRREIVAEMERQGIPLDPGRLDDTALLTRLVMKRCIYGVDLNPMAVQLAKLSLWLHSFTVGAPLSFLDHHLRWGNSLVGADVRGVEQAIRMTGSGQLGLFAGPFAGLLDLTAAMIDVAGQSDATLADVRHSAETFDRIQRDLIPYKQILDLWVSQYFGNADAREFLTLYGADVLPALKDEKQVADKYQATIQQARVLWKTRRFFHWDLEFPEVFVDLGRVDWKQNGGFDAVVGNPPYDVVEKERLQDNNPYTDFSLYLSGNTIFKDASGGKQNLFRPFLVVVASLVQRGGCFGQIVPLALLTDSSCNVTLESLLKTKRNFQIQAFPQKDDAKDRVFSEAKLSTCIVIGSGSGQEGIIDVTTNPGRAFSPDAKHYVTTYDELRVVSGGKVSIPLASTRGWDLVKRLRLDTAMIGLDDLVDLTRGEINQTIYREYITRDASCEELLKGSEIGPYEEQPPSQGLKEWFDNDLYERHTSRRKVVPPFRVALQRISGVDDARRLTATIVDREAHFADSLNSLVSVNRQTLRFALALINSKLLNWCFRLFSTNNNVSTTELADLPIRSIAFTTPADERARLAAEAGRLADAWLAGRQPLTRAAYTASPPAAFVAARLAAGQSDAVHDLLAALAEQMIAMHKEKQGHVRAFRLDLAGYLDEKQMAELNRLYTPKKPPSEKDRAYAAKEAAYRQAAGLARAQLGELAGRALDLDDFWQVDQAQWVWLLRDNLGQVAAMSELVAVYERYHARLAPLMRRIRRTDWLIDQVVYQAYGLTEEEIGVVEGRPGAG